MSIKINEIFQSIQGEGRYAGLNTIFIRTSGCNLNCTFCDSKYHTNGAETSVESLKRELEKYNCSNLVITGGEPLLHQEELYQLIKDLPYFVTVETNGTIVPTEKMLERVDHWSVSPKLANSGNDLDKRINYDALTVMDYYNTIFKFVITDKKDLDEVLFLIKQVRIDNQRVWLMPEGITSKSISEKSPWIIDLCKKYNFNYSPRLQILIWENKKGV